MAEAQPIRESVRRHRRDTRWYIILPTVVVFLLLAGVVGAVLLLPRSAQVSIVSDFVLTIMILCPMVICFLPITIGFVAAIFGMNRAHDAMKRPFYRLEDYSKTMVERTETVTGHVNRQTINISARFGAVYKLLGIFEPPEESSDE